MSDPSSTLIFRRALSAAARRRLRAFAGTLEQRVCGGRHFSCLLAGDRVLHRLNKQFLGHDYPTDVLSFPSPGPDGFLGEMAISLDRAAEQSRERGHSLEQEISILMLHGVLHLLGLDHERDRGTMARAERRWRKALDLPAGLIERVPR